MTPFLQTIVRHLHQTQGEKLSDYCIVFPNRRAGLFFNKYLAELTEKPTWAPAISTINEIVQKLSHLQVADNLALIAELYIAYKAVKKSDESFDSFYSWGEMLLGDFDEIDKYLVNADDLFRNLAALKDIDDSFDYLSEEQVEAIRTFWKSFDPAAHSPHRENFISVWEALPQIYSNFRLALTAKGIAYEGMIYRETANRIKAQQSLLLNHEKYIFIGFNSLNRCEESLFDYLQKQELAEFYWDYDTYYLQNPLHEAGASLRMNIKKYPSPETGLKYDHFTTSKKDIEFIAVPSEIGQAKLVHDLLGHASVQGADLSKTAIVLADERLLPAALHSIPANVCDINITMGYPLKDTPASSLAEHLIDLQKGCKVNASGGVSFYYRHVVALLNHRYIRSFGEKEAQEMNDRIVLGNKIYVSAEFLGVTEMFRKIFRKPANTDEIATYLLDLIYFIYRNLGKPGEDTGHDLGKEYLYRLYTEINRINDIVSGHDIKPGIDTFLDVLRKRVRTTKIPFEGEPLAGLQVMGLLETRVLDFENVIMLSLNEGIIPAGNPVPSFIPYNLRKGFGIPAFDQRDAIFAYYFYRLLQRASHIRLLYNSASTGSTTGEMSRFLYQLKYESGLPITEKTLTYNLGIVAPKEIRIKKTPQLLNCFNPYFSDGQENKYFSPTAINSYLDCSLRFYFRYVAHLEEPEEVAEDVDSPLFGNLVHNCMQRLYEPFTGGSITALDLDNLLNNTTKIDSVIKKSFSDIYFKDSSKDGITDIAGKNILVFEVLKKYITRLLETDKKYTPIEILELEKPHRLRFPVNISGKKFLANIGGTIDRADKTGQIIRIIDYKTGSVKNAFTDVAALFSRGESKRSSAVFQTFLYSLLYTKESKPVGPVAPGVYWIKDIYNDAFDWQITQSTGRGNFAPVNDYVHFSQEFESNLGQLLDEIFDREIDFTQAENTDVCSNCAYTGLCHR